jgi:hypothetical protein
LGFAAERSTVYGMADPSALRRSRGFRPSARRTWAQARTDHPGPQQPAAICVLVAALIAAVVSAAHAQPAGTIRVEVVDASGARLPHVAVVATVVTGQTLTDETDRMGVCVLHGVPTGPAIVRLRRDGFAGVMVGVTVEAGAEARVSRKLEVAPIVETVTVEAPAPIEAPPPPRPPLPPPTPPRVPLVQPVPPHDHDSVCGPAKAGAAPESFGSIRSTRYVAEGGLYTSGSQVAIDGGTANGLDVGQNLVARRLFHVKRAGSGEIVGEHTAGVVQIVAAAERSSIAVVIYACDELRAGDFLASFQAEPIRPPEPRGTPDYDRAARILFADEAYVLGAPRRPMVIDQGTGHGLHVGQRLTLFRRPRGGTPDVLGDAVVVAIRPDSATIRVERVQDTVTSGDFAAPQTSPVPPPRFPPL